MHDLLNYLKNPVYNTNRNPRLIYFLFLLFIYIAAVICLAIFIIIICNQFHLKHNKIGLTPLMTIFIVVILAPIYEEIIFRSLLKFKKNNIILFFAILSALIVFSVFKAKIKFIILLSILLFFLLFLLIIFSR